MSYLPFIIDSVLIRIPTSSLKKSQLQRALYMALVAFLFYTTVFAYRKPFTVATFEGLSFFGVSYQILLVISQGIGYMLSKFFGIKLIAELKRIGRWRTTLILIGSSWIALFLFAIVPPPYGMIFIMANGFLLGFMWGIVFSYVEGRRTTDFIGAALAVSFIFAGGFTRSVAVWIRDTWQAPESWLGFLTGLVFMVPLLFFLYLIEKIPQPDVDDVADRTIRLPMTKESRSVLLKQFGFGLLMLVITYVFLTIMRDIRDNFMSNMWNELGYGKKPAIFTSTETITSIVVLIFVSMLVILRNNFNALQWAHGLIIAGFFFAGIASILFRLQLLSGAVWMQLVGLGLYMGYVPFNCILFERFLASFRIAGNVGFLIYIADAWGYLGSMSVMVSKEFFRIQLNWVSFYSNAVVLSAIVGIAATIASLVYFRKKYTSYVVS